VRPFHHKLLSGLAFTQEKKVLAKAGDVNKVLTIGIGKLVTCKACLNAKA